MMNIAPWYHRIRVSVWLLAGLMVQVALYGWLYGVFGRRGVPTAWLRLQVYPILFGIYFALVWLVCQRREKPKRERCGLTIVLVGAVILRGTVLLGATPHNGDVDRYLWEGLVLRKGFNPYAAPPKSPIYAGVRTWLEDNGDNLYEGKWTKYAGIRSVYGPVATVLFAVPWMFPDRSPDQRIQLWRSLMALFDLATVVVLVFLARALEQRPLLVLTYAWSPLAINAFADRGQVDAVVVLFVTVATLLVVRTKPIPAGMSFAAAVLTKLSPLPLLLPLLRVGRLRTGVAFLLTSVFALLPFASAGVGGLRGFNAFAHRWETCDSVFPLVRAILTRTGIPHADGAARSFVVLALLCYALAVTASGCPSHPSWLVNRTARIAAAMILLSPVTFPWYAATLLAFVALRPLTSLLALTTVPMLWYLRFVSPPNAAWSQFLVKLNSQWTEPWRVPAYGVVLLLLLRDRFKRGRND